MPQGLSVEGGVHAAWVVIPRLARLVLWTLFAVAHLALAVVALAALWAFQVTPADVASAFRYMRDSSIGGWLVAVGLSALTLLVLYWKLVRWMHRSVGQADGWLGRYLLRGIVR